MTQFWQDRLLEQVFGNLLLAFVTNNEIAVYNNSATLEWSIGLGAELLTQFFRSSYRIPGHWPPSAERGQPDAKALPDAHIRTQHCGCKVSILVLLDEAPKG